MPPTVSINLCCYNSEEFLEETLQSIFAQTYKDWELIIINDGSTDSTESIIKKYISQGYPIVYHWQENHGLGYSRNEALKRSRGKYIAFIDHDDLWMPEKLEKQVQVLENRPEVDFVYSNFFKFDPENNRRSLLLKGKQPDGDIFESLLYHYDIGILTVIVRKKVFNQLDELFDENLNLAEEYDVFMRFLYDYQAAYLVEPLAMHRVHPNMCTRKYWKEFSIEVEYVVEKLKCLDPCFEEKYFEALKHCKIQLEFQKAKDNMAHGNLRDARKCLAPYKWFDYKFFVLYLASYMPIPLWFFLRPLWTIGTFR